MTIKYAPVVEAWRDKGSVYSVDGLKTYVWSEGEGDPVVCIHGVPASAYCYRKLLPALAQSGMRGIVFDLPGLGLSDRPESFDYNWSQLGVYASKLIVELKLSKFHLLVHDIGGPVGFGVLGHLCEHVKSLTVLNTMVRATKFRPHPMMGIFRRNLIGELALAAMNPQSFAIALNAHGFAKKLSKEEYLAYYQLLIGSDQGRSFLRIMRSFELTQDFEDRVVKAVAAFKGPRQIIWGTNDHALPLATYGEDARQLLGCSEIKRVAAKHFLQEDCYSEIAATVASQASR